MKFRFLKIVVISSLFFSNLALADWGTGAVDIGCEKTNDLLSITTSIKWNEEYDSFMKNNPTGASIGIENAVFLLDTIQHNAEDVKYSCQLKSNIFKVTIDSSGHILVVNKNGVPLYKFTQVYPSDNDIYGLSYTIKNYHLKIQSDEKVVECITRDNVQEICSQNIINEIQSTPNKALKVQPSAAGDAASGAP